jgi:glycosyltransferase involved in cell wall biosynthesis
MTKVAHLTSVHVPFDTRIFHKECATLAQAGYEVVLVVPHERDEVVSNVRLRAVPKPKNRLQRMTHSQWHVFRAALTERADIYHLHDPELIGVGLLLKACTRAAVIYDVHEYNPDTIVERGWIPASLRPTASRLADYGEIRTSRFFDAIVTADTDVAKRFHGMNAKITTLFNFPSRELYTHAGRTEPPSVSNTRRLTLAYVGVMGRSRGLWLMLDALEILLDEYQMNVALLLAGPILHEGSRQKFTDRLAESPLLSERVNWLGPIPQPRVPKLLAEADIGWVPLASIPKFHKNIPTKLFEYMACGLPVVASDLPPIRRFLEPADAGCLALPDDARSHADKIAFLLQHPVEAGRMGRNGRCAFETRYNWESEAAKLVELYDSLAPTRKNA